MVALNTEPGQERRLLEWRTNGNYSFPVALSSAEDFAEKVYGVSATPTTFLLSADGRLIFRHKGSATGNKQVLEAEIRELLGLDPFAGIEPDKPPAGPEKK
jgi:hypothetical protein